MGTEVSVVENGNINAYLKEILNYFKLFDKNVQGYFTGGCLCKHPTNDIDFMIVGEFDTEYYQSALKYLNNVGVISEYEGWRQYSDDPFNFDFIGVTKLNERKIDLLCVDSRKDDVYSTMHKYPLSKQMVSMLFGTNTILFGSKHSANPIRIYREAPECVLKYKGYYPDVKFTENYIKQEEVNPFM